MVDRFDVFRMDSSSGVRWMCSAPSIKAAKLLVRSFQAADPGEYFLHDAKTGVRLNFDPPQLRSGVLTSGKLPDGFRTRLSTWLERAMAFASGDMGNIQLLDVKTNSLRIVVQQGFSRQFLEFFSEVHDGRGASCGAALHAQKPLFVEDVGNDPIFSQTAAREIMLLDGVEACQSVPLVADSGQIVGMLNVHYFSSQNQMGMDHAGIGKLAENIVRFVATRDTPRQTRPFTSL